MSKRLLGGSPRLYAPDYRCKNHERPEPVRHSFGAVQGVAGSQPDKSGWARVAMPPRLMEMLKKYENSAAEAIGWCLLCDSTINSEQDLIAGTNTHNCERGRQIRQY